MRVKAQVSASVRVVCAAALAIGMFASGPALSASGQAQTPAQPAQSKPLNAAAAPTILKITPDEAVRMALENNLGVQADRLGPQIGTYGVAQARAAYGLTLGSLTTTRSATQPPTDFLNGGDTVLTNDSFRTNAGIQQLVPWGGGRYTFGIDASRVTTSNPTGVFNPQLDSSLAGSYTQPLLRNFTLRQRPAEPGHQPQESGNRRPPAPADADADLARRSQLLLQPRQRDWPAAGRAEVARAGADLAQEQPEESGARHDRADRHRAG